MSRFLKPYCCPQKTYLTSACCGVSMAGSVPVTTKRIIGGAPLADATFPWLVFVTQLYRPSAQHLLSFVSNCSGSLISDRVVLTAAHCLELDESIVHFNAEFPDMLSIVKVYVGLRNLTGALSPEKIATNQIKVRKILIHPQYNRYQNE